jgi:hypothetical protein
MVLLYCMLQVSRGATQVLQHLSLVQVAGIDLLFMVNPLAVKRVLNRSEHLVM